MYLDASACIYDWPVKLGAICTYLWVTKASMHSSNPPGMLLTAHPFTERHSPYIWIQAASRGEICLKDSQEARGGWTQDNWFIRIHKTTRTGHGWCHLIWRTRRCIWKIMHHHLLLQHQWWLSFPVDCGGHSSCSTNIGISPPNLRVTPVYERWSSRETDSKVLRPKSAVLVD